MTVKSIGPARRLVGLLHFLSVRIFYKATTVTTLKHLNLFPGL